MPLFGHTKNNSADETAANTATNAGIGGNTLSGRGPMNHAEADPLYNNNNDRGTGEVAGYHIPGVGLVSEEQARQMQAINFQNQGKAGPLATSREEPYHDAGMGMGSGHQNSAMPQGGMAQGVGVNPGPIDRDLATSGQHNMGGTGAGMGAGVGAMGGADNGMQQADLPDLADAKKLERSGKLDKILGAVTGNTRLKQEGVQKQADAAAIRAQTVHLTEAQRLEQEAHMRRNAAVGLGAHPSHGVAPGHQQMAEADTATGVQPSYGGTTGAAVGTGVGGGAYSGLK